MKFRLSKKEKIGKEEERLNKLCIKLSKLNPTTADLYVCIGEIDHPRTQEVIIGMFFEKASMDDLFCLAKFRDKYRKRACEAILQKAISDKHTKMVLLHMAEEIPDFAIPAIEKIREFGELTYEDTTHLLSLRHVRNSIVLVDELTVLRKEYERKIGKVERIISAIKVASQKLRDLQK